jgi:hypothetical protein
MCSDGNNVYYENNDDENSHSSCYSNYNEQDNRNNFDIVNKSTSSLVSYNTIKDSPKQRNSQFKDEKLVSKSFMENNENEENLDSSISSAKNESPSPIDPKSNSNQSD